MPFDIFGRSRLKLKPLNEREHDLDLSIMLDLDGKIPEFKNPDIIELAERVINAKKKGASVIMMLGGHVIRSGVSKFLIELMKRGLVNHFALNGACAIHDYEFALIGATTENVERYINDGQFGLWKETGKINEAAKSGVKECICIC